jgi:hypothetical protein
MSSVSGLIPRRGPRTMEPVNGGSLRRRPRALLRQEVADRDLDAGQQEALHSVVLAVA